MKVILDGVEGVKAHVGQQLGTSDWLLIDQDRIDRFAAATDDYDWIHVDPVRAKESPFGRTIAHGYLTMSLIFPLLRSVYQLKNLPMGLNYGIDRLRFVSAVPVNSRIRINVTLKDATDIKGGVQFTLQCTFEIEGGERPAAVADVVLRFYETTSLP